MRAIVLAAKVKDDLIEIEYSDAYGRRAMDYLHTAPVGDWVNHDFFDKECYYVAFLNTMVEKNVEVYRKMIKLHLDVVFELPRKKRMNLFDSEFIHAMRILDPTFYPPVLNMYCSWQMHLLDTIVEQTYTIVANCRNVRRLKRYFTFLQDVMLRLE
jgi:hypothetical protein